MICKDCPVYHNESLYDYPVGECPIQEDGKRYRLGHTYGYEYGCRLSENNILIRLAKLEADADKFYDTYFNHLDNTDERDKAILKTFKQIFQPMLKSAVIKDTANLFITMLYENGFEIKKRRKKK